MPNKIPNSSCLLFKTSKANGNNILSELLVFLKIYGPTKFYDFTFIGHDSTLHKNLTLKENLSLEIFPMKKMNMRDFCILETLKKNENEYLYYLASRIKNWDLYPSKTTPRENKICELIKSLLSSKTFILMEKPESNLNEEDILTFSMALNFFKNTKHQTLIVSSSNKEIIKQASHLVLKCEGRQYEVVPHITEGIRQKFLAPNTEQSAIIDTHIQENKKNAA